MRAPRMLVTLGLALLLSHCAGTAHDDTPAPTSTGGDTTLPPPSAGAPPSGGGDAGGAGDAKPAVDCSLTALTGIPDIDATFVAGPPPPTMTGGTLAGEYVVHDATVFLPSGASGLVDPKKSSGRVSAWAIFKGTRYLLHMKSDFSIATVAGPQAQSVDTESQGGFTATGAALTLDHACDAAIADEADYSFTDDGAGHATILIKTPTPYGDTYLQLDATRN